jgi:hypothetical protein
MKNALFCLATISILLVGLSDSLNAQKITTWKGGTPGRCNDWFCAQNWKEGRVPDEFSNVVIPDVSSTTRCYPVIKEGEVEVQSVQCAPNTTITVFSKAQLIRLEPSDIEVATSPAGGFAVWTSGRGSNR